MLLQDLTAPVITRPPVTIAEPPSITLREGRYTLTFARTAAELDEALRLRFAVFNMELGEGLSRSYLTGRDADEFDAVCQHLLVRDEESGAVIGTYRLQTGAMAAAGPGFYSAGEFDLSEVPAEVLSDAIELGRACIAQEHRHTRVLMLLWKGLAAYAAQQGKRYLFGCCSLTSQDARAGWAVTRQLGAGQHLHPALFVPPRPGFECELEETDGGELPETKIPKLFGAYLRFGAQVCGPPALDRAFGTIDFFVLLDVQRLDAGARKLLFG